MKRSQLYRGQHVIVKTGRTYASYTDAYVIFTAPWEDHSSTWSRGLMLRPATSYGSRSGVAVAMPTRNWNNPEIRVWEPRVVPLSKLITPEQAQAEQDAERRQHLAREAARQIHLSDQQNLADRIGVERHLVTLRGSGDVIIPRRVLEDLLDERASLREQVGERP